MIEANQFVSPNDWLRRAGARIEAGQMVLPLNFLLIPMTLASEAVAASRGTTSLSSKMSHSLSIALLVRTADTAYFNGIAGMFRSGNPTFHKFCGNCIRQGKFFGDRMHELRRVANRDIIHKMESGSGVVMLSETCLDQAIEYYDEMLTFPLTNPISFPNATISFCQKCKENPSSSPRA